MEFPTENSSKTSPFLKLMEDRFRQIDVQTVKKMSPTISKKRKSSPTLKFKKSVDFYSSDRPKVISNKNMQGSNMYGGVNYRATESWSQRFGWWEPNQSWLPVEFFTDTSLHGLKFIGQPKRHLSERIFWLIAFISGLVLAIVLISDVWTKYNESPVIVSFQPTETSVDQVPFPAVTICNMNKILKSKASDILSKAQGDFSDPDTILALRDVYYLDHVCSVSKSFTKKFNYSYGRGDIDPSLMETAIKMDYLSGGITNFLRKASQKCSDMIPGLCIWQDEIQDCTQMFREIETDFGSCCTFNFIPQTLLHRYGNDSRDSPEEIKQWQQWNLDKGGIVLEKDQEEQPFPRRQMAAGKTFGLSFALNPNLEEYFCTTSDSVGFRLQVHLPIDVAHVSDFGVGIKPSTEVFVEIKPDLTMADKLIYGFSLKKRQCYYTGEITLKYYSYYSASNCIDECIANATYADCQCVRYYMPRDENQALCGPQNFTCAEDAKRKLIKKGVRKSCSFCLPTCTEMSYNTDTTTTPLQDNLWVGKDKIAPWFNSNVSILHVYIGQDSFYPKVRKELFGSTDLFANTGGLMGLCLGFSGLSLMEVVYFLTLRAWCRNRRKTHDRSMVGKKCQELWRKTKELVKNKLETNDNGDHTTAVTAYGNENIIMQAKPNRFLTTVSINDEFARKEINGIQYKDGCVNINMKQDYDKTVDYSNVFGEINKFYKNN